MIMLLRFHKSDHCSRPLTLPMQMCKDRHVPPGRTFPFETMPECVIGHFCRKKAFLKNMIFDSQRFSFKRVWIWNKSNAFRVLQSLEKERLWPYAPDLLTASFSRRLSKTKWYSALVMTYCAALRHTGRSQHLRKCGFCGYSPKGYIGLSYLWGSYPDQLHTW